MKFSHISITSLILFSILTFSWSKPPSGKHNSEIQPGWSKTSVNATIFRKNSLVSFKGYQYAAFYDSTSHVVLAKRKLTNDNWSLKQTPFKGNVNDAHNIISIMIDGNGFLHLAWDHHNNPLNYSISKEPGSLTMNSPSNMIGRNEKIISYPEFYKLDNGDLIFAYRDGGSGNGNLVLNKYITAEKKWIRLHDNLIDGESKRNAYWQLYAEGNNIHISWVWRESPNVASNHDMCYAKSYDGGKTWVNSKNESYNIPITITTAETIYPIPQNSNLINQTSMTVDKKGNPYIATYFKNNNESCTQFYVIYNENGEWKLTKATNRKLDFNLSGGGSRSIPISRPQIVIKKSFFKPQELSVIYRDEEFNNKIIISSGIKKNGIWNWITTPVYNNSVDRWEPSFDTELWRTKYKLHLYIQKVGQGQGETSVKMPPQMVSVLEIKL